MLLPQRPGDLGRRLAYAFRDLLSLGLGPVILIGSDAPAMPTSLLAQAVSAFTDPSVDGVLGPSEDGGYYLVGLGRPSPELFSGVPWSSPHVFDQTMKRARSQRLRITILPKSWDIDTPVDLQRLKQWLASHPAADLAHTRRCLKQLKPGSRSRSR